MPDKEKNMTPCTERIRLEKMEEKLGIITQIQTDVESIKNALLGDEYHPDNGLVNGLKKMERRVETVEKFNYKVLVWVLVVVGSVTTAFKIYELVSKLHG